MRPVVSSADGVRIAYEVHGTSDTALLLMSGVGHFLMMEDPDRFNGLLTRAIDTVLR